jgi:amphi-Trp domain-containing protein
MSGVQLWDKESGRLESEHRLSGRAGDVLPRLLDEAIGTGRAPGARACRPHDDRHRSRAPNIRVRASRAIRSQEVSAMDDEATVFEFERSGDRAAVAAFLRQLADGIERGRVELLHDGEKLVVEPPDELELEVEVELEEEGDEGLESSIEIEISWTEGGRAESDDDDEEEDEAPRERSQDVLDGVRRDRRTIPPGV